VPEVRLDRLGMRALSDEEGRARMPEVVDTEILWQAGRLHSRKPDSTSEVGVAQRSALRSFEYQRFALPLDPSEVCCQHVSQERREGDDPPLVGLGRLKWSRPSTSARDSTTSRIRMCFLRPVSEMSSGSASWLIVAGPPPSRSRMSRRVGSARAEKEESSV
jgi:hypothetical protein